VCDGDDAQASSMADVVFNASNSSIIGLYPANYLTLYVDVVVPANSTVFGLIDVSLPLDGLSAVMTVASMDVVCILVFLSSFKTASTRPAHV